jgi:hypothetical protein
MNSFTKFGIAIILSFASVKAAWAGQWIPESPQGGEVEFVSLEFTPGMITDAWYVDSKIQVGLKGDTTKYWMYYFSGHENARRAETVYEALAEARINATKVRLLTNGDTRELYGISIGASEHPLALVPGAGRANGFSIQSPVAGKARFDIMGRNISAGKSAGARSVPSIAAR